MYEVLFTCVLDIANHRKSLLRGTVARNLKRNGHRHDSRILFTAHRGVDGVHENGDRAVPVAIGSASGEKGERQREHGG